MITERYTITYRYTIAKTLPTLSSSSGWWRKASGCWLPRLYLPEGGSFFLFFFILFLSSSFSSGWWGKGWGWWPPRPSPPEKLFQQKIWISFNRKIQNLFNKKVRNSLIIFECCASITEWYRFRECYLNHYWDYSRLRGEVFRNWKIRVSLIEPCELWDLTRFNQRRP